MKKNTKELLDDMLEDGAPEEFRATLLDKILRSVRRRKRVRRFNMALSAMVVAGICAFSYWKMRGPGVLPMEMRQIDAMAANSQEGQLLQPKQVVITRASSVKEFVTSSADVAEVETTGLSGRYKVIDAREALAAISEKAPVPSLKKVRLKLQPNIRHLQCAVPRASQPPIRHQQVN